MRTVRHLAQPNLTARWRIDAQLLEIGKTLPDCGSAPDHHIEDLLLLIEVPDGQARDQCGGFAAYVARPQAVTLSRGEIDLDLQGGLGHLRFHSRRENAGDRAQHACDVIGCVCAALARSAP